MTLHAHFETYSTDCDGAISRTYVEAMNDEERAHPSGDIHFHNRIVASVVDSYALMHTGRLDVTKFEDGTTRLSWSEPTEEGRRNVEATFCEGDCEEAATYRDHAAEAAGY